MILTLWRHGEAEMATPDRQRALNGSGRDDVAFGRQKFLEACSARKIPHPHKIFYSPWLRTTQTAEIIAAIFSHATLTAVEALQPGGSANLVDAALSEFIDKDACDEHLLLVTHQPLVSHLIDYYLCDASVPFLVPGGLVTLFAQVLAPACGELRFWALPPEYEAGV